MLAWAGPLAPRLGQASPLDPAPFEYGVASGDPAVDRVVIWTRVTADRPTNVGWQVALDPSFLVVVAEGAQRTDSSRDYTVNVDVPGLAPGTTYWYRFRVRNERSRTGRTRTAPAGSPSALRFAVTSCHEFQRGYYAGWRRIAARSGAPATDLDFVLFVGDYIYEHGYDPENSDYIEARRHDPVGEIFSLEEYRTRYRQYRSDPDLRDAHAAYPFVAVWDDHEVVDNRWKDGAPSQQDPVAYLARRSAAYRAYVEYIPMRRPDPANDPDRIYRALSFGDLADLVMLDTRTYRDPQVGGFFLNVDPRLNDQSRTILGAGHKAWFKETLGGSTARWRLVGNQTMIANLKLAPHPPDQIAKPLADFFGVPRDGFTTNADQWDGYMAERREILEFIGADSRRNCVFLTGDLHTSFANELYVNSGNTLLEDPVAVEFMGPSLTSENFNEFAHVPPGTVSRPASEFGKAVNPHVKYLESDNHGYVIAEATSERVRGDWYHLADHRDPQSAESLATSWEMLHGDAHLRPAS